MGDVAGALEEYGYIPSIVAPFIQPSLHVKTEMVLHHPRYILEWKTHSGRMNVVCRCSQVHHIGYITFLLAVPPMATDKHVRCDEGEG